MRVFSVPRRIATLAVMVVTAALFIAGCSKERTNPVSPAGSDIGAVKSPTGFTLANPAVRAVADAQERHTAQLMSIPGVVGTATGLDANGDLAVMVLTE